LLRSITVDKTKAVWAVEVKVTAVVFAPFLSLTEVPVPSLKYEGYNVGVSIDGVWIGN
jgi:hypothetical protein